MTAKSIIIFGIVFAILLIIALLPRNNDWQMKREAERCAVEIEAIRQWQAFRREELEGALAGRQAAWLYAKADKALELWQDYQSSSSAENVRTGAQKLMQDCAMLLLASSQSSQDVRDMVEENGARLRAFRSKIDGSFQNYSVRLPAAFDSAGKWPLVVFPETGSPSLAGVFCLYPTLRGQGDFQDLQEIDLLEAIAEVRRDFPIDDNLIYLSAPGGGTCLNLAVHYADQFAAVFSGVPALDEETGQGVTADGELQRWSRESRTFSGYAANLRNLPVYLLGCQGSCSPEYAGKCASDMREAGCPLEYREFAQAGESHNRPPESVYDDGLAWLCGWGRDLYPRRISWKSALLKYGKAYWLRFEQFEQPLVLGEIQAEVTDVNQVECRTSNLQAFSMECSPELFTLERPVFVRIDGQRVILPARQKPGWVTFRKDVIHGWDLERYRMVPPLFKHAGQEGPIPEAFLSPFVVVVGTQSPDRAMNQAWQQAAKEFACFWQACNSASSCRIIDDKDCDPELLSRYNVILFGDARDNLISELIGENIPWRDALVPLVEKEIDLEGPSLCSLVVYPTGNYGNDRLQVRLCANSPRAAEKLSKQFNSLFNLEKQPEANSCDYAVFDTGSEAPDSMLLRGWFGTDWQVESGRFFLNESLTGIITP